MTTLLVTADIQVTYCCPGKIQTVHKATLHEITVLQYTHNTES